MLIVMNREVCLILLLLFIYTLKIFSFFLFGLVIYPPHEN